MRVRQPTTWLLVADAARAEVLAIRHEDGGVFPVLLREMQTRHDREGRGGRSHGTESNVNHHEFDKRLFARAVARDLDKAALAGEFDRLVLVAPPKMLGLLRAELSGEASSRIVATVAKSMTNMRIQDLLADRDIALAA